MSKSILIRGLNHSGQTSLSLVLASGLLNEEKKVALIATNFEEQEVLAALEQHLRWLGRGNTFLEMLNKGTTNLDFDSIRKENEELLNKNVTVFEDFETYINDYLLGEEKHNFDVVICIDTLKTSKGSVKQQLMKKQLEFLQEVRNHTGVTVIYAEVVRAGEDENYDIKSNYGDLVDRVYTTQKESGRLYYYDQPIDGSEEGERVEFEGNYHTFGKLFEAVK